MVAVWYLSVFAGRQHQPHFPDSTDCLECQFDEHAAGNPAPASIRVERGYCLADLWAILSTYIAESRRERNEPASASMAAS